MLHLVKPFSLYYHALFYEDCSRTSCPLHHSTPSFFLVCSCSLFLFTKLNPSSPSVLSYFFFFFSNSHSPSPFLTSNYTPLFLHLFLLFLHTHHPLLFLFLVSSCLLSLAAIFLLQWLFSLFPYNCALLIIRFPLMGHKPSLLSNFLFFLIFNFQIRN